MNIKLNNILLLICIGMYIVSCSVATKHKKSKRNVLLSVPSSLGQTTEQSVNIGTQKQQTEAVEITGEVIPFNPQASNKTPDEIAEEALANIWTDLKSQGINNDESQYKWLTKFSIDYEGVISTGTTPSKNPYTIKYYEYMYFNNASNNGKYTKIIMDYIPTRIVQKHIVYDNINQIVEIVIDHGQFQKITDPNKIKYQTQKDMWSKYSKDFDLYKFTHQKYNDKHLDLSNQQFQWKYNNWNPQANKLMFRSFYQNPQNNEQYYIVSKNMTPSNILLIPVDYSNSSKEITTRYPPSRFADIKIETDIEKSNPSLYVIFKKK